MKLKDLHGITWKVYIEEWGLEGLPRDEYKLDRINKVMYVFAPVRFSLDWDNNDKEYHGVAAFLVDKWREMVRYKRTPYTKITKYVAQQIVNAVGSNVGHVRESFVRGDAESGEIWISLVNYD